MVTDPHGELADRYVLEDRVATGGLAEVWRAHDRVLARTVAVKMLHEHLETDANFVDNFRQQALTAAKLAHPNIVAIYDSGEYVSDVGNRDYLVMEHCASSLRDYINDHPNRDFGSVSAIGTTLCGALQHAHEMGVIHRDLKPENIYLGDEGTLKIADFGIAKAALEHSADIAEAATILGPLRYMAPEVLEGSGGDVRSDIYSLGAVLYELLTGRAPFDDDSVAAPARRDPPSPRTARAGVPRDLDAAVMRALAEDPENRWQSAAEFGRALDAGERAGATSPVRRVEKPREHTDGDRDSRWLAVVIVAIVLAVGAAITVPALLEDDGQEPSPPGEGPPAAASQIEVAAFDDFDPHGDSEHPDTVGFAVDGDEATAWDTEDYNSTLADLGKTGVGILLDLGESKSVETVTITGTEGTSIEIRAGDEPPTDETSFEEIASGVVEGSTDFDLGGAEGRYWLVWITELPGGTGSAALNEVTFFGG